MTTSAITNLKIGEKIFLLVFIVAFMLGFFVFFNFIGINTLDLILWQSWFCKLGQGVLFITHLAGSLFIGLFVLYLFRAEKPKTKIKVETKETKPKKKKKQLLKG